MKTFRLLAMLSGILACLAGLGAVLLAASLDVGGLKEEIARVMLEQKQRRLDIDGDMKLTFFPGIGLETGEARLSERGSGNPFASVDSLRVKVRLMPLLVGRLVFDAIAVKGARVNVVRYRDGSFNFADLLAGEQEQSSLQLDEVAALTLVDGAVDLTDEASGRVLHLGDVELAAGQLAKAASGPLRISFRLAEPKWRLDSLVSLEAAYSFDLDKGECRLQGLGIKGQGDAFGLRGAEVSLAIRNLAVPPGVWGFDLDRFDMRATAASHEGRLDVRIDMPALVLASGTLRSKSVTGEVKAEGVVHRFAGHFAADGLEARAGRLQLADLAVLADFQRGTAKIDGNIAGPVEWDLESGLLALPKLAGGLGVSHPQLPSPPLRLPLRAALKADLSKPWGEGEIYSSLDGSPIVAKWRVSGPAPLAIDFDLAMDRLDADKYLAAGSLPAGSQPSPVAVPGALFLPEGVDLRGKARIGLLRLNGLSINKLEADIGIRDGKVTANPAPPPWAGSR